MGVRGERVLALGLLELLGVHVLHATLGVRGERVLLLGLLEFLAEAARCNSYCSFRRSSVKIIAACAVPRPMILGAWLMDETTNESVRRPSAGIPKRRALNALLMRRVAGTLKVADIDYCLKNQRTFKRISRIIQVFVKGQMNDF